MAAVLDRLRSQPIDEILVVDNGSTDGTAAMVQAREDGVRLVRLDRNIGMAGRNVGLREATSELVMLIDDDSYPLPEAVERMREAFRRHSRLGAAGGMIHDRDPRGKPIPAGAIGTFDWWLRGGRQGQPASEGFPSTYFPECGCVLRREAALDVGGFFEPYFFHVGEIDMATRLLQRGWDVRYLPTAEFEHYKAAMDPQWMGSRLRLRVRNQLWYFWLRLPTGAALRYAAIYLLIDLCEGLARRQPRAWAQGVADAWRERDRVRFARNPIPRELVPRVLHRHIRMQFQFALYMARRHALPWLSQLIRTPVD